MSQETQRDLRAYSMGYRWGWPMAFALGLTFWASMLFWWLSS